jgi:hypothetical protein
MTSISGHTLIATPCCKSIYKTVVYGSMNNSASGIWTDGEKEHSLSPTDGGLRMCRCGKAFLLYETTDLKLPPSEDTLSPPYVAPDEFPKAIATAINKHVEVTARRNYWRHLNDAYRVKYREHQEKKIAFERKLLRRASYGSLLILQRAVRILRRSEPRWITDKLERPFTVPPYTPTTEQIDNMKQLLALIQSGAEKPFEPDGTEIVELYRELGQFENAKEALSMCTEDYQATRKKVIAEQIDQRSNTPMRYRG